MNAFHRALLAASLALSVTGAYAAPADYRIVTGGTTGTYYAFGQNLASVVAPEANITLGVLSSAGSVQNVRDMRYREKVKFALVQSDVYQAYIRLADQGDKEAQDLIRPLRVVLPLYMEEMHFVVAADSPLKYIDEIRGKKIYMGPEGSGAAISATTLYELMFDGERPNRVQASGDHKQALNSLLDRDGKVDVIVFVAGQPISQLAVDAELGRKHYRLLAARSDQPVMKKAMDVYYPTEISRQSYGWLAANVPTLSVKAYLITYDYPQEFNRTAIAGFARSLCSNYDSLLKQGHPKWHQVAWRPGKANLEALKAGWQYYSVTRNILSSCSNVHQGSACTPERKLLGLC
ncbi:MAG TPA: TAXI family TRAP transporter solute-binding subunit [Accumulibacter sp.]|nr:TAXI family TRAP transporter solute-binding subunit [Accumulibacter sp.]HNC19151.1 TAXI family TRAP transporter solute-binding subunit [Accumulibacter sp.]HND81572.1 TAXI family TRAP transporter solute-binding subunit [Accumulibacter sp.]HNE14307.1 TAXI family TRAP transporter solute-binding subunit [Accumulibacter sp.]HNK01722.1 TAXI family TRAP transporter solute-binding subunit [Accumulibacter sp.]